MKIKVKVSRHGAWGSGDAGNLSPRQGDSFPGFDFVYQKKLVIRGFRSGNGCLGRGRRRCEVGENQKRYCPRLPMRPVPVAEVPPTGLDSCALARSRAGHITAQELVSRATKPGRPIKPPRGGVSNHQAAMVGGKNRQATEQEKEVREIDYMVCLGNLMQCSYACAGGCFGWRSFGLAPPKGRECNPKRGRWWRCAGALSYAG